MVLQNIIESLCTGILDWFVMEGYCIVSSTQLQGINFRTDNYSTINVSEWDGNGAHFKTIDLFSIN